MLLETKFEEGELILTRVLNFQGRKKYELLKFYSSLVNNIDPPTSLDRLLQCYMQVVVRFIEILIR